MVFDLFEMWGTERAKAILDALPNCKINPATRGERKGDHLKHAASYSFSGRYQRDLVIDLRSKKSGVEIAVNALSVDGLPYQENDFPKILLQLRRPKGFEGSNGNPGIRGSVNRSDSLKPKYNETLELYVRDRTSFIDLIAWYGGQHPAAPTAFVATPSANTLIGSIAAANELGDTFASHEPEGLSPEALAAQIAADAKTGHFGEIVAIVTERERLALIGCANVDDAVKHVSLNMTDAGFDIESKWNGERRCIEVKSSTTSSRDFFLSANERIKLTELGSEAWLYRVIVRQDGTGEVVEMLQDPMTHIPDACFRPTSWRVKRD